MGPALRVLADIVQPCPSCAALRARIAEAEKQTTTPIVCICGSTRFKQAWITENARLTGEGNIVLAVGLWGHHERTFPDEKTKAFLDNLHLRRIDLCDWVWVLDVGGYIGESTRNEIAYAEAHGKAVRYLSKEFPDYVEPGDPLVVRIAELEKQVATLEEYVLKGVAFRDELQAKLAEAEGAREKAETGSFRVDAGVKHFLDRWSFVTNNRGQHDAICIDMLSDAVMVLRTQQRQPPPPGPKKMVKVLEPENARLCDDIEHERLRLAACGVAAMSNTQETVSNRLTSDHSCYSASYSDVCGAVDREMALRSRAEKAEAQLCAAREAIRDLNKLIISAQETMTSYLIPDGIEADEAIERVIELLDGKTQHKVQQAAFAIISNTSFCQQPLKEAAAYYLEQVRPAYRTEEQRIAEDALNAALSSSSPCRHAQRVEVLEKVRKVAGRWHQHERICTLQRFSSGKMDHCSCGLLELRAALAASGGDDESR
ncbi:MAG: hypothetical protein WA058_01215 [Minisyncoccia bacterium]